MVRAFAPGQKNDGWSEAETAIVIEEWPKMTPGSAIALRIWEDCGKHRSRSAVMAKVHRLVGNGKLPARDPDKQFANNGKHGRPKKRRSDPNAARNRRRAAIDAAAALQAAAADMEALHDMAAEAIENIIPIGQRCSIMELGADRCHWPIGDPGHADFFFCGGRTVIGLPYCGYHCRIAYQPSADPRRERHR